MKVSKKGLINAAIDIAVPIVIDWLKGKVEDKKNKPSTNSPKR